MQTETETVDGIARATYRIERSGVLEIYATSGDQGARSNLIRLDTVSGGVTVVPPTPLPTETPTPTPTITVTVTVTVTPTPIPPATVHVADWFYVLAILLISALVVSVWGMRMAIARWGLRWALCGVIGGILAYNYLALTTPRKPEQFCAIGGTTGILLLTLGGILLGWAFGYIWKRLEKRDGRSTGDRASRSSQDRPVTGPKSQSG